jgi:PadR family transcriptional regulator PadR
MNVQMKKGILEMCILHEVAEHEPYGYEILKSMSNFFPEVDQSTIYAILRRLNADGHTETYLGDTSNGPPRKYYRITETGKSYLKSCVEDWKRLSRTVNEIGI